MRTLTIESPLGPLRLFADGHELTGLWLPETKDNAVPTGPNVIDKSSPVLEETARQLREYFAGTRRVFELPLAPRGSGFQERVWRALLEIPFGQTWSYGQLAKHIGRPSASRAVGTANGSNPISIIVPCHWVIGANGTLTGYGGGLPAKRWLLKHEGAAGATLDLWANVSAVSG